MALLDYLKNSEELDDAILDRLENRYKGFKLDSLTKQEKELVHLKKIFILNTLSDGDTGERLLWDVFMPPRSTLKTENLSERNLKTMELQELFTSTKQILPFKDPSLNEYIKFALIFRSEMPESESKNFILKDIVDYLITKYREEKIAA